MRRIILAAVAALLVPSLAPAKENSELPTRPATGLAQQRQHNDPFRAIDNASLGNGMNNRSNGDVAGPGKHARIDDSSKGPMDDLHPGNPFSEDVPRSANPRPVR
jgi:hypothetical protein